MAVECGVIAFIFLLLVLIYFRRGHKEWATVTLPLMLLPLADFITEFVLVRMLKLNLTPFITMLILVMAVVASAAWIGVASTALKTRHSKRTAATFIGISNVFNIALAAILISDIFNNL